MKKLFLLILSLLFIVPAGYCVGMNPAIPAALMQQQITITTLMLANKSRREQESKIETCLKYQGGKSCHKPQYLKKVHEER
jgi:hypothetical protein